MFTVEWEEMPQFTAVPDSFITKYLPEAPGEYVKVFICLLMLSKKNAKTENVNILADLNVSRSELNAALKYWEGRKLLELYYRSDEIIGVKMRLAASESSADEHRLSRSRVKSLMTENNDAQMLAYVAEQYFSRPLTPIELSKLLFFMDKLEFSLELCEYLVEYCVSKGHRSIRYIEKVALAWHKKGYRTVEEAKAGSSDWSRIHFDVLKAFGMSGINPTPKQIEYIDKWYNKYGFSLDVISKACDKALTQTGKPSFEYADTILTAWSEAGVRSLADAEQESKKFNLRFVSSSGSKDGSAQKSKNQFLNYNQRKDDLDELERELKMQFIEDMEKDNASD